MKEVLKDRFPRNNWNFKKLSKILLEAAERGKYRLDDEEDILFFEGERLLLPKNFYQSRSWDDRLLTSGSDFLMPETIRYLVKRAEEEGEWNPEYAVERYLDEIGEENKTLFLEFFKKMKKGIESCSEYKKNTISGDLIVTIAEELGMGKEKADVIRGEFKKGGIISPCSSRVKGGCLSFEINPSLLKK
ncbi:hypothetical protein AKJ62_04590 [candidate division MSBL1 archaeon SCGC-AAA259D14]|uniref:Uncharacterized protein n=1 Tax=candidate division MSBL1 archaeon SCGC-AAA259D14 TaxID=1698261 RepID=A0A133U3F9_9EURY|nr:hypothetical protein AKJ62_04590 [candidate division MSBL1 archaeon SCGC-AAA259D14]